MGFLRCWYIVGGRSSCVCRSTILVRSVMVRRRRRRGCMNVRNSRLLCDSSSFVWDGRSVMRNRYIMTFVLYRGNTLRP